MDFLQGAAGWVCGLSSLGMAWDSERRNLLRRIGFAVVFGASILFMFGYRAAGQGRLTEAEVKERIAFDAALGIERNDKSWGWKDAEFNWPLVCPALGAGFIGLAIVMWSFRVQRKYPK